MPQPRAWRTIPAMNDLAAVDTKPALPQCVINCVVYDQGGKRRDIGLDEISDVLAVDDGSFIWVGLYEPADAILEKLQEEFCLHDLAVEDAQNAHQRPKLEAYGNSLFVAVHTAQVVDDRIRFGETPGNPGTPAGSILRSNASARRRPRPTAR